MPAPIPDRYKLEMRLGRDVDIEEWLATDTSLERPVLVRSLGPESSMQRRAEFEAQVRAAATVAHPHLARVFAVDQVEGGAYSVSEWTGGATLADRVKAERLMDLEEFLPNAAGLAGALAALHATSTSHGALDLSAISYSAAHPAKIGAFGRAPRTDMAGDVRALAGLLETAVTGNQPGGPPPSESIDGFPRSVDRILRSGQSGSLTAEEFEKTLRAAPTPRPPTPEARGTSRRLLIAAGVLVLFAIGLVALGRLFVGEGPIIPVTPTSPDRSTTTTRAPTTTLGPGFVEVTGVASFDPFGEGGENDEQLPNVVDGNPATTWRSERYQDPLEALKPGVGILFEVSGLPGRIEIEGLSPGTSFEIFWGEAVFPRLEEWERLLGGNTTEGDVVLTIPPRADGHWLLWLVRLPEQSDGSYYASLAEVRFLP